MIGNTNASTEHRAIANSDRARNSAECRHDNAASQDDIVGNLAKVVDLCSFPDNRVLEHPSVDATVRADGHMVLKYDTAEVRRVLSARRAHEDAKSSLSDPGTGEDGHMIANQGAMNGSACADRGVSANLNPRPNDGIGSDHRSLPDNGAGANHGAGLEDSAVVNARVAGNSFAASTRWRGRNIALATRLCANRGCGVSRIAAPSGA